jgi:hypothetical protein
VNVIVAPEATVMPPLMSTAPSDCSSTCPW